MDLQLILDLEVGNVLNEEGFQIIKVKKMSLNSTEATVIFPDKFDIFRDKNGDFLEKKIDKFIKKQAQNSLFCTYMLWDAVGDGMPLSRKMSIKIGRILKKHPSIESYKPMHFKGYGTQRAFKKYERSEFEI